MAKKYLQLANILKRLLFDNNMKAIDLAREIDMPAPTIHRLLTGKSTRPYQSSLKPIADYFAISTDELLGEKPLHFDNKNKFPDFENIHCIPVFAWEHLLLTDKKKLGNVAFTGNISEEAYATLLDDSSMEPIFSRGSILILDPKMPITDRCYVLVHIHETKSFVFRQLIIDLDEKYLKPLNPDLTIFKMRLVNKKDLIVATLVESRQMFNAH